MTQTRKIAAFLLTLSAAVVLTVGYAQLVAAPASPVQVQPQSWVDTFRTEQAAPGGFDSLRGTEALSVGQLGAIEVAADQICEGLTAEVPVMVMADQLVRDQGMTDQQARAFVNEVATERCAVRR